MIFAAFRTFALMVPVLITGAWAEKFKFTSAVLFMILWPILVDYAGGIDSHTSSGATAFVVAMMLQKRRDFKNPDTTHNLPLTMIGVSLT